MLRESDSSASKISEVSGNQPEIEGNGLTALSENQQRTSNGSVGSAVGADNTKGASTQNQTTETVTGFWPVLQNRNFLTLWGGQVFSQLADKVYLVLMIAIIASQYDAPGQTISGWVAAIMIAFTIPAVLFGSLAGVYVDRWLKQPV
ncbi:MAG: MFS transporter, partial [Leptolyngbya sp. SIO3F4]|nr:MFS transporter [Leptolyngbya sp. SIO3F4]